MARTGQPLGIHASVGVREPDTQTGGELDAVRLSFGAHRALRTKDDDVGEHFGDPSMSWVLKVSVPTRMPRVWSWSEPPFGR